MPIDRLSTHVVSPDLQRRRKSIVQLLSDIHPDFPATEEMFLASLQDVQFRTAKEYSIHDPWSIQAHTRLGGIAAKLLVQNTILLLLREGLTQYIVPETDQPTEYQLRQKELLRIILRSTSHYMDEPHRFYELSEGIIISAERAGFTLVELADVRDHILEAPFFETALIGDYLGNSDLASNVLCEINMFIKQVIHTFPHRLKRTKPLNTEGNPGITEEQSLQNQYQNRYPLLVDELSKYLAPVKKFLGSHKLSSVTMLVHKQTGERLKLSNRLTKPLMEIFIRNLPFHKQENIELISNAFKAFTVINKKGLDLEDTKLILSVLKHFGVTDFTRLSEVFEHLKGLLYTNTSALDQVLETVDLMSNCWYPFFQFLEIMLHHLETHKES